MTGWLVGMSLGESIAEIFGLLVIFILILFLTYLTTRWIAKQTAGQSRAGNIRVIETYRLATNRYLQIVKVAERYFVLAVSREQIALVAEVSEDEIQMPKEPAMVSASFQDILKKLQKQEKDKE